MEKRPIGSKRIVYLFPDLALVTKALFLQEGTKGGIRFSQTKKALYCAKETVAVLGAFRNTIANLLIFANVKVVTRRGPNRWNKLILEQYHSY